MQLQVIPNAHLPDLAAYAVAAACSFEEAPAPVFFTATSTEYLGRRPLPRAVRDGHAVLVLGPRGVGKSRVSERLAGEGAVFLDSVSLHDAIIERVRTGHWCARTLDPPALLLEGPSWLGQRRGVLRVLSELVTLRSEAGRKTIVMQCDADGSALLLVPRLPPGHVVVVGLRFPVGARGKLRFARRLCDELNVPRCRARGTEILAPWGYKAVAAALRTPAPTWRKRGSDCLDR